MAGISMKELVVCSDAEELNRRTAEQFVRLATESVAATGRFTVALSGGSTPKALYSLLPRPDISAVGALAQGVLFLG